MAVFQGDRTGAARGYAARDDSGLRFSGLELRHAGLSGFVVRPGNQRGRQGRRRRIWRAQRWIVGARRATPNIRCASSKRISEFLNLEHTVLYPTGWAAGYGVIKGLVRPNDHVVLDGFAHACLQEGAYSATSNVHLHGHLNVDSVRRHLKRIRAKDTENGIMVVTESLFSMDSDSPDLRTMQELCREYRGDAAGRRRPRSRVRWARCVAGLYRHAEYARANRYGDGKLLEDFRDPMAVLSPATRRR